VRGGAPEMVARLVRYGKSHTFETNLSVASKSTI
jgi:hypothetical protein